MTCLVCCRRHGEHTQQGDWLMQWWCSAAGVPWSWDWRPYPGVWLFILAIAAAYRVWVRRAPGKGQTTRRWHKAAFASGLLLLWIALDWPVGALGAGYLASLHMAQFILIGIASPALLLLGRPRPLLHSSERDVSARWTHPLVALGVFTVIMFATHLPVVTDTLMPTQLGSFVIDVFWLAAGLMFWRPVLDGTRVWFSEPVKIAYLFASMVLMTAPGAMITFSDLPIYATYELAPPIPGFSALADQRLAGVGMRFGGSGIMFLAISILFWRWNRAEEKLLDAERVEEKSVTAQPRG